MAGAAPTFAPLDLDAVRTAVAAGRPVRVGILPTGQFPEGAAGRVRAVGAPDTDGPEFIQVELTVGGAKDVVPFAPGDLSPLRRGQTAPEPLPAAPRARRTTTRTRTPGVDPTRPADPPARSAAPARESAAADPGAATTSTPAAPTSDRAAAATDSVAPGGSGASGRAAIRRSADRTRRQPITVTLATVEPDHTGWRVTVTVGSRTVVKPTPVHPAQAWTLVTGLGQPEVEQFVAGALADHRRQAQERADRLAQELAAARADLAAYPDL